MLRLLRGIQMHNQQLDSSAIEKLQRLIKNRFGKDMKLRQLIDAHLQESLDDHNLIGEDLYIALKQNNQFLGTVIIPEASDLKKESREQISRMIRMVMEPTLYSWFLERKENNLQQISSFNFSTQNLSVFDDLIRDEIDSISKEEEESVFSLEENLEIQDENKRQNRLLSKMIHLSGKTESINRKVALQIHDMAHRWAFVPLQDIAKSITNVDDLRKLGALTVYVNNIEEMDYPLQQILVNYLNEEQSDEEPLIISSSAKTSSELKNCESLVVKLKEQILINSFEVDHAPLSYSNLKDVLEMFFFKPSLT